jgi:acetyl-CoA C-acetyltransferase
MSYAPRDVVITHALRTPIGRFLGGLSHMSAADLGVAAARAVLGAAGFPERVAPDLAIFGCARQAGAGPNVARQIAVRSGLPVQVPAFTVNMACASGMKAIALAAQAVATEEAEVVLCGGTESMSRVPHLLVGARQGYRLGHQEVLDAMYKDGLHCPLADMIMAETVERNIAETRREGWRARCDAYAAETQRRCEEARKAGRLSAEIARIALAAPRKGAPAEVAADEHPRDGVTVESLAKLPALYRPKEEGGAPVHLGAITAGNASGITDGAAALLVTTAEKAAALGLAPLAKIGFVATAALDPARMGYGPVPAVRTLLSRARRALSDYDLIELNEAFAAQALLCADELGLDLARVNVNGGAIALGHPIGCTGARIVVTLAHEMARRGARRGIATLCVSGGMGMAMEVLVEAS